MYGSQVTRNRGQVENCCDVPDRRRFSRFLLPACGRGTPAKVALACATLLVCAAAPVEAQTSWGAGVAFTSQDPLGPGLQASGYFALPALPRLRLGTDFTYYRPATDSMTLAGQSFGLRFRMWELSTNLQYLFVSQPAVSVYGLGGVSMSRLTSASLPAENAGRMTSTVPGLGVNAGAGIELPLGFGALFGEGRYLVVAGQDRYTLGAGIRIRR